MKRTFPIRIGLAFVFLLLAAGCASTRSGAEGNREVVRRYFDRWANHADTAVADQLMVPDLELNNPPSRLTSLADYKRSMVGFHEAFPDLRFDVEELIAEGDRVVARWTFHGTNRGGFLGQPPTGRAVSFTGTSTFHLVNGRICQIWVNMDRHGMLQQLGLLPSPAP